MTLPASDELVILACEALETRSDPPGGCWLDFAAFQAEWAATHVEEHGRHTLSFWQGPETEVMALLTEGRPAERTLVSVDHRPGTREPCIEARQGTFLQPGAPLCWWGDGHRLADFGVFAGWWPCEPGAKRLRLTRRGEVSEIEAISGGFILVDWNSPAPVDRFDAVEIDTTGWVPTALPILPFTGDQLVRAYERFHRASIPVEQFHDDLTGEWAANRWAYELFSITDDIWFDAVVAFLRHADLDRDFEVLGSFGALIYANGHAYYDRMERELKAGAIDPNVLGIVLSMERPEFMDHDLRMRHLRLVARCG